MSDAALIIIDAQVNQLEGDFAVLDAPRILTTLKDLVARARKAGWLVVFVQNNGTDVDPDQPGTPGWQLHPDLKPLAGEPVIQKWHNDSFQETPLGEELSARKIRRLVIAGMQTNWCINATTRRALELGYEVTLVRDAHSTFVWQQPPEAAAKIIAEHNEQFAGIMKLVPAATVQFA